MSINGNESAFPEFPDHPRFNTSTQGLTKREYIAAAALRGLLAGLRGDVKTHLPEVIEEAVTATDLLIKRLNNG